MIIWELGVPGSYKVQGGLKMYLHVVFKFFWALSVRNGLNQFLPSGV